MAEQHRLVVLIPGPQVAYGDVAAAVEMIAGAKWPVAFGW
jgi:hypothetical protein